MSPHPVISVLMPAYNAEKHIALAIESILSQTFADFEFIIIDDASLDRTPLIIEEYAKKDQRIVFLKNSQNLKISGTLNIGLQTAKGEFICRMDADDWSYPERLGTQLDFMKEHPEVVISGANIEVCDQNLDILNIRTYPKTDPQIRNKILKLNPFAHPVTFYKTEIAKKVGGYDANFNLAEDYDLYFRMGKYGQFANISKVLLKLRTHSQSLSAQQMADQARINYRVRLKAIKTYGYKTSWSDKVFLFLNYLAIFLIPKQYKFQLYNFLRRLYG